MNRIVVTLVILFIVTFKADGHELSTTFASMQANQNGSVQGELKLDLLDLKDVLALDLNLDGKLTWGEIQESGSLIQRYVSDGLRFRMAEKGCLLNVKPSFELQELSGVSYLIVAFESICDSVGILEIDYSLLFDAAANHKAIFSLIVEEQEHVFIIDDSSKTYSIDIELNESSALATFAAFIYQGIYHIIIGLDHILFLFTLLLTVCLYRSAGEWQGIESSKVIVKKILWIVTSFTIAHSITLSGTALGIIPTMGSWIEVVIAASILFNVINNIFPMVKKLSLITFIFGLIHGMGFAGALSELGLTDQYQLISVVGFNLGVELGQLVLLCIFLPILLALRKNDFYRWFGLQFLSVILGSVAIYWVLERW